MSHCTTAQSDEDQRQCQARNPRAVIGSLAGAEIVSPGTVPILTNHDGGRSLDPTIFSVIPFPSLRPLSVSFLTS